MNDRQDKRARFEEGIKPKKRIRILFFLLGLAAFLVGGMLVASGGPGSSNRLVTAVDGVIAIPLAEVSDGEVHFYTYRHQGVEVKFFVLKSRDGVVRVALDTCDVCYEARKGYRQEGDFMVCNNCDQKFRNDMINEVKGGCNPAPLERLVSGDRVVIAAADLVAGLNYFAQ